MYPRGMFSSKTLRHGFIHADVSPDVAKLFADPRNRAAEEVSGITVVAFAIFRIGVEGCVVEG